MAHRRSDLGKEDMTFKEALPAGSQSVQEPTVGNAYYVKISRPSFEAVFQARLTLAIQRDHRAEPDDRTPTFSFDNGLTIHGEGIAFYQVPPVVDEERRKYYQELFGAIAEFEKQVQALDVPNNQKNEVLATAEDLKTEATKGKEANKTSLIAMAKKSIDVLAGLGVAEKVWEGIKVLIDNWPF
jgi:hypothetical protein